jgi:uncharacterized protein
MACKAKALKLFLLILLVWAYPALAGAVTPPIPAHPSQYVVDLARVIDAQNTARLNAMLRDLEAKTTAQMVVLTINSLDGEPLESFSHQTAVKWRIGQKGKDNGVLLTVVVKDHKYRIEVGYGLEGTLPDSLVGSLGRQYLVPNFRKGDYAAGILATVRAISEQIAPGKVLAGGAAVPKPARQAAAQKSGLAGWVTLILVIVFIILLILVRPGFFLFFLGFFLGGGGGGWSSGGGFGGSGGFSGGGGDFGGGGASGDW